MDESKDGLLVHQDETTKETSEETLADGPKGEVNTALKVAIVIALLGPFMVGYNISVFNVPEEQIRATATQYSSLGEFQWELVNAMFPLGGMFDCLEINTNKAQNMTQIK